MNNSWNPPSSHSRIMPQFNVASLIHETYGRIIFAWRTDSNIVTVRVDDQGPDHHGTQKHMSIEAARSLWSAFRKEFKRETDPLAWELIHDILPLH